MRMPWSGLLVAVLGAGLLASASVQAVPAVSPEKLVASLDFRDGEIAIGEANARLKLGEEFRFLGRDDARRVLENLWGNPPDEEVLGLIVPRGRGVLHDEGWAVVMTYSDEGYVSDEDAARIDYSQLLAQMKQDTVEENAARRDAGFEAIDLIGWAAPPRYDVQAKKLYWAQELAFEGNESNTLNYDIRVLGRHGYLSLNAVSDMRQLADVQAGMQRLLPMVEFDAGARYADYDAASDKAAGYGLAALVGGGLAAKSGLLAKLGAVLLAGKKFIALLLIALAAIGKIVLGRRPKVDATL